MSERLACKAVGLARSTHRRLPLSQTPDDPDAEMRAWLRAYATKHPCHGFRRAWAALRYDERREVNKKRSIGCGAKRDSKSRSTVRASEPACPRHRRSRLTRRMWCGRSISSSTPPSTARPSRSHRCSTSTPACRCYMWWNARSPPSGWCSSWRSPSPRPVAHRGCCGWTTAQRWFLKRCNGSARTRSG